jgi:plastocyanin
MKNISWILALFMGFLIACSDDDDFDDRPANEVWMSNVAFIPTNLNVTAGTTVTWVNNSTMPHTVTSTTGLFDELLGVQQSFSFTFNEAGTFSYVCTLHAGMAGTITVE